MTADGRPGQVEVVVAERARYELSADSIYYTITLYERREPGRRAGAGRSGGACSSASRRCACRRPRPRCPGKPRVDVQPTHGAVRFDDPRMQGELHWRFSSVIITLALGLLAVPMAKLRPAPGTLRARGLGIAAVCAVCRPADLRPHAARARTDRRSRSACGGCTWPRSAWASLLIGLPRFNDWRARQKAAPA